MKCVLKIPFFGGFKPHFLHQVDLSVARRTLYEWVVIGYHNISGTLSLYIKWPQVFIRTKTPHAQVAIVKTGKTSYQRPFFPSCIDIKMSGFFLICRRKTTGGFTSNEGVFIRGKLGAQRFKTHHSTDGIAAVNDRAWSKKHFGALGGKRVQGNHIL